MKMLTITVNVYSKSNHFVESDPMFKINRQTDYAVRVILALAKRGRTTRVSTAEIQQEMLIPKAFMTRIVAQLAHAKLLNTFPGRDGGLTLPCAASKITLRDVVEAFEGPILLSECMQTKSEDDCPFRTNCPVRSKWGRVQVAMLREMASITFEDLVKESHSISLAAPSIV